MQQATEKKKEEVEILGPPLKAKSSYESLFTGLIAPFIATRYLWLAIEDINPKDFLGKKKSLSESDLKKVDAGLVYKEPGAWRYASRNFAAFGMGATFLGIIGLYSKNTLHDIKSLYAESVGYELNKKTEDVTLSDIFMKSENAALKVTRSAYLRRTAIRLATGATFFLPWQKFRDFKELQPKYDANANAGVGAVGVYLLAERFLREKSFFDAEQQLVSSAIHHNNANPTQAIGSMDIKSLLLLQRKHINSNYEWPLAASNEGKDQLILATRIASLMNQTYLNEPNVENAHLTVGKFNYLAGFGLLDAFPESLGFVELASKSSDMKDVKEVANAIRRGENAKHVFAAHGIDITKTEDQSHPKEPVEEAKFAPQLKPKPEQHFTPKSHQDFAAHSSGVAMTGI